MVSSTPLALILLLHLFLKRFPEAWGQGCGGDFLFRAECSKVIHSLDLCLLVSVSVPQSAAGGSISEDAGARRGCNRMPLGVILLLLFLEQWYLVLF